MSTSNVFIEPSELWSAWSLEPLTVAGIVVGALVYRRGLERMRAFPRSRVHAFYAGLALLAVAVTSPLAALGHTLFSAHMVQHLLLIVAAAPLIVYGAPLLVSTHASSAGLRRAVSRLIHARGLSMTRRALWNPVAAGLLQAAVMWVWHLPSLYEAALRSEALHILEHLSFLATGVLFWSLVVPSLRRPRADRGAAALLVFFTGLQSGALGALLTFAARPLYPIQAPGALAWGLDPLRDQQLAGAIMWVPTGIVYLVTILLLIRGLLDDADRHERPDREMEESALELGFHR